MRLLIDQNLSRHLVHQWSDIFPGSTHVAEIGLDQADDRVLWRVAETQGSVIITKDSDFDDEGAHPGPPPKVIRLLIGNAPTKAIDELVRGHLAAIVEFETDDRRLLELE